MSGLKCIGSDSSEFATYVISVWSERDIVMEGVYA